MKIYRNLLLIKKIFSAWKFLLGVFSLKNFSSQCQFIISYVHENRVAHICRAVGKVISDFVFRQSILAIRRGLRATFFLASVIFTSLFNIYYLASIFQRFDCKNIGLEWYVYRGERFILPHESFTFLLESFAFNSFSHDVADGLKQHHYRKVLGPLLVSILLRFSWF